MEQRVEEVRPVAGTADGTNARMRLLARNTGAAVLIYDADMRCIWIDNLPEGVIGDCSPEGLEAALQPEHPGLSVSQVYENALVGGRHVQVTFRAAGGRSFELSADPIAVESGGGPGLLVTLVETTSQRRREQALRALLREVSHRSKNLLAIIQSVATQTGRYSGDIDTFLERFRGRIQSLAASQDLVTSSNWHGARFRELIADQVHRYCDPEGSSLKVDGIDPYLNPNAALHVGLALHELAVNSVSYGALGLRGGEVQITCAPLQEPGIRIAWTEVSRGERDGRAENSVRFGRLALEKVVPAAVAGQACLEIGPQGLRYVLDLPPENYRKPL